MKYINNLIVIDNKINVKDYNNYMIAILYKNHIKKKIFKYL